MCFVSSFRFNECVYTNCSPYSRSSLPINIVEHKRKVSQLAALEEELGLYFDEAEAERIAKETMKEINPNKTTVQQISMESIVAKAKQEHKRKVSQFEAIKHDIGQFFADPQESALMAAEVMKEVYCHCISLRHCISLCHCAM